MISREWVTDFTAAGVLTDADALLGQRMAELCGETDARVALATCLALRALQSGSVCFEVTTVAETVFEQDEQQAEAGTLPWPDGADWLRALEASPMVTVGPGERGVRPLRLVDGFVYLERYWADQESVRRRLQERRSQVFAPAEPSAARTLLDSLFPGTGLNEDEPDLQRRAAATALCTNLTVLAGGPGTGKTTTVARTLALLIAQLGEGLRIAMCAPTGKAANRLAESLREQLPSLAGVVPPSVVARLTDIPAATMHRLLGFNPRHRTHFRHDPGNPLPYDVVVVDEVSMVSLAMMARLLEALTPATRLILVGDPEQLTSVDAGAVLADIARAVAPPTPPLDTALAKLGVAGPADEQPRYNVVELVRSWRFGAGITALADAIRRGDDAATLGILADGYDDVRFVDIDLTVPGEPNLADLRGMVRDTGQEVIAHASAGDAGNALKALDRHRLLCAHRLGPCGVARWAWLAENWVTGRSPTAHHSAWYAGLPLLVNENLGELEVYNGDTGVVVATPTGPMAAFPRGQATELFTMAQLSAVTPMYAITVHKSQGSQFGEVSLILPPPGSPLLTRELLYTAVTRAKTRVTIYGRPDAMATAVTTRAWRASGLRERLSSE